MKKDINFFELIAERLFESGDQISKKEARSKFRFLGGELVEKMVESMTTLGYIEYNPKNGSLKSKGPRDILK